MPSLNTSSLGLLAVLLTSLIQLALPSQLDAADRGFTMIKTVASKTPAGVKKRGLFSLLFGGRGADESRQQRARSEPPRDRSVPVRSLTQPSGAVHVPSEVHGVALGTGSPLDSPVVASRPYPEAPMLVIRGHDNTPVVVQPLLGTSAPGTGPGHANETTASVTAALDLAVPASASGAPAAPPPSQEPESRAAVPLFASPVPGRPGLVYPPGLERIPANIVDVTGLTPGSTARDPVSKIIFLVP